MPKYAWVVVGMLTSAAGGAAGAWIALHTVFRGENQATSLLIAYGGVFAAIAGGVVSLGRGRAGERQAWLRGLMALLCGIGVCVAASPLATLVVLNPLALLMLVGFWPFALLGGFGLLALLWASLRAVGIRAWHAEPTSIASIVNTRTA